MKKLLMILTILLLTGCMGSSYETVTTDKAKELIDQDKVIILDVRTPEEYNSGHIPGSELVPVQVIEGMSEELDKDKSYLLVCRSGNRSEQAAEILSSKGFKSIYNMSGGMNEWSFDIEN